MAKTVRKRAQARAANDTDGGLEQTRGKALAKDGEVIFEAVRH